MGVVLRDFADADAAAFDALNRAWLVEHDLLEEGDERQLQQPRRTILDAGGRIIVAVDDGEVVGTVAVIPHGPDQMELAKLSVAATHRGRGLGRTLSVAAIDEALSRGMSSVMLVSSSKLDSALRLYEDMGFAHVDMPDGVPYVTADVSMALDLVAPPVRIRRTTPSDLDFVIALEHHPDQLPFIGQWTRAQHEDAIARADREHWIIERRYDRRPAGYLISYDVERAGYGHYVKRIAVSEKSKGLGRRGLERWIDHAFADLRASSVCLAVRAHNERAQRAYRGLGFVELPLSPAERARMVESVDAFPDECLVMRLARPTP